MRGGGKREIPCKKLSTLRSSINTNLVRHSVVINTQSHSITQLPNHQHTLVAMTALSRLLAWATRMGRPFKKAPLHLVAVKSSRS